MLIRLPKKNVKVMEVVLLLYVFFNLITIRAVFITILPITNFFCSTFLPILPRKFFFPFSSLILDSANWVLFLVAVVSPLLNLIQFVMRVSASVLLRTLLFLVEKEFMLLTLSNVNI